MVSTRRIGFFWGEDKITLVEFDKNAARQVVSAPFTSKTTSSSPFSSNYNEEIQVPAILQKLLQGNQMMGATFYISLSMKDIILRSFIIPFVKNDDIQNLIKFEAKKYIPFEIQDLSYVFHAIPFMENQTKRLQVIFFAARKEALDRYQRLFQQLHVKVSCCEPYMVSLSKALLFRKDIKPTDHLAILILDKSIGRICFIDKGIPQFIREFPLGSSFQADETSASADALNLKIVDEVGNSFDFYTRQFNGDRIEQMLISSEYTPQQGLFNTLETELKIKLTSFNPMVTTGLSGQSNGMDALYAMGACVSPVVDSLSEFNFMRDEAPKSKFTSEIIPTLMSYKEIVLVFLFCIAGLVGIYFMFQNQLKVVQQQYARVYSTQGTYLNVTTDSIQAETQQSVDKLTAYKNIRTKSDLVFILLRVSSHLPQGALLSQLDVKYIQDETNPTHVSIDMKGNVFIGDSNEQIAVANQIFSDFKNDKQLSKYVKSVNLVSLNREDFNGQQSTGFNIHCS